MILVKNYVNYRKNIVYLFCLCADLISHDTVMSSISGHSHSPGDSTGKALLNYVK